VPAYKAVLFDLDGTLLNTLEDLADSVNAAVVRFGFPPRPVDKFRYYVGDGLEETIRRVLPDGADDDATVRDCMAAMREEYGSRWNAKTTPYPGVAEMLDGLAAGGLKMAVLSNKADPFTKQCVRGLLGRWRFDVVLGVGDGVPIKPDPTGALRVARELDVPPAEFLYLGDTATDMTTANAAGMYAVGALWGFRTADELTDAGARVLLSDPPELLDLLD